MKFNVIITGTDRQIELIPEDKTDEALLKLIQPGTMFRAGLALDYRRCQGGYLRSFQSKGVSLLYLTTQEPAK